MGGRSLTLSLCLGIRSSHCENTRGAFHHCMTEYRALRFRASVLSPVTPRRTTGFNGLNAYDMYGFQSHRGEALCEAIRHCHYPLYGACSTEMTLCKRRVAQLAKQPLRTSNSYENRLDACIGLPSIIIVHLSGLKCKAFVVDGFHW